MEGIDMKRFPLDGIAGIGEISDLLFYEDGGDGRIVVAGQSGWSVVDAKTRSAESTHSYPADTLPGIPSHLARVGDRGVQVVRFWDAEARGGIRVLPTDKELSWSYPCSPISGVLVSDADADADADGWRILVSCTEEGDVVMLNSHAELLWHGNWAVSPMEMFLPVREGPGGTLLYVDGKGLKVHSATSGKPLQVIVPSIKGYVNALEIPIQTPFLNDAAVLIGVYDGKKQVYCAYKNLNAIEVGVFTPEQVYPFTRSVRAVSSAGAVILQGTEIRIQNPVAGSTAEGFRLRLYDNAGAVIWEDTIEPSDSSEPSTGGHVVVVGESPLRIIASYGSNLFFFEEN